jgi:hypothetical protein
VTFRTWSNVTVAPMTSSLHGEVEAVSGSPASHQTPSGVCLFYIGHIQSNMICKKWPDVEDNFYII